MELFSKLYFIFLRDVLKIRKIIKSNKYDCVYAAGGAWQIKEYLQAS